MSIYDKVVFVAESPEAPHFLNSRKGAYVRTDERSQRFIAQLANYEELTHLASRRERAVQRRERLLKRARQRFKQLVSEKYATYTKKTTPIGATMEIFVSPRYPCVQLAQHGDLLPLLREDRPRWKGGAFPILGQLSTQQESASSAMAAYTFSLIEVGVWGNLFLAAEVEHTVNSLGDTQVNGIFRDEIIGLILVTLEHCRSFYERLGYMGLLDISVRVRGVRNKPWVYEGIMDHDVGPFPTLDDGASANLQIDVYRLGPHRDDLAVELLKSLLYSLNWAEAADNPRSIDAFVQAAYRFNRWTPPG